MCNINIKKIYTIIAYATSFIFYGFALTTDKPGLLYKSISYLEVDGRIELYPEYGFMHTVIYAAMVFYVIVGVVAIIYGMRNEVRASIKNMEIMLFGEFFTMVVFFIYGINKLAGSPAILYVISQLLFLVTGYRSYYYDIDRSVMDTVVAQGDKGYLTFDFKKRLLGCNEVAEKYFPELKTVRVDKHFDNYDGIKATINQCLQQVETNHIPVNLIVPCNDKFISLTVDEHRTRGRLKIYRVIMDDDTDHQNLIKLLNKEKDDAILETKHVSDTFHRYVDPNIADTLLDKNQTNLNGVEKNIAVLFTDIRGFTSFSENKEPHEVLTILNKIIETCTQAITKNGGIVDKFIGDCVMAAWDNQNEKQAVYKACDAALDIQDSMKLLMKEIKQEYNIELHVGVGINFGKAIVGNVGTDKRSDYTSIGNTVNVASRLESVAKGDTILISPAVKDLIENDYDLSLYQKDASLKGVQSKVDIYKLNGRI